MVRISAKRKTALMCIPALSIVAVACSLSINSPLAAAKPKSSVPQPVVQPAEYRQCAACHSVDRSGGNRLGPNLWGVGSRASGSMAGYTYSPAMKDAKIRWNRENLISFIADPRKTVPRTRMPFAGVKNPAAAEKIADYLLSLK